MTFGKEKLMILLRMHLLHSNDQPCDQVPSYVSIQRGVQPEVLQSNVDVM